MYLEPMVYRPILARDTDPEYIIEPPFKYRPDLLAYDLYGDSKLWWVFVHRNREVLKDPVFDFVPGVVIRCPRKEELFDLLSGAQ